MDISFKPSPHEEAIALVKGKPVVLAKVFYPLPPEIRARLFTISGVESANVMEAVREEVAAVPSGQTWDKSKKNITAALEPYFGKEAARIRAEVILRVNCYQALATANHRYIMASPNITHCRYVHGNCEVPTPSHLALDGIILPKDDPFWDDHTGPWGHLGCVCRKIGLFGDTVAAEEKNDQAREPDEKMVLTGPALSHLHDGDFIRAGKKYSVGTAEDNFQWHPDYLGLSLQELKARYDSEIWSRFKETAQRTTIEKSVSLWEWLGGE